MTKKKDLGDDDFLRSSVFGIDSLSKEQLEDEQREEERERRRRRQHEEDTAMDSFFGSILRGDPDEP